MAEPVLMMSETANPDLIDVSPDCREQICCDSLLPALGQERVWLMQLILPTGWAETIK